MVELDGGPVFRLKYDDGSEYKMKENLIISTGDLSDADGFYALANYAKSNADVIFIMNYPAYLNVSEESTLEKEGEQAYGLGYEYNASTYFDKSNLLL